MVAACGVWTRVKSDAEKKANNRENETFLKILLELVLELLCSKADELKPKKKGRLSLFLNPAFQWLRF
jgi:hypothetical protein